MSNEPKYQPYVKDTRENSNDIRENSGANSTEPYRPHGWEQFEQHSLPQNRTNKEKS